MFRIIISLLLFFLTFYSNTAEAAFSTNVTTLQDTGAMSDRPTDTYGSQSQIRIASFTTSYKYGYIKPNLSSIPSDVVILGGIFNCNVYRDSVNSTRAYVKNVTSDWNETTLNWNNKPPEGAAQTEIIVYHGDAWHNLNIDPVARAWNINRYGMIVKSVVTYDLSDWYYYTKEYYDNNKKPTFDIYYYNKPTNLIATATQTSVTLSWSNNGNDSGALYTVYRNGTQVYKGSITEFTDTGLTPGTTYDYIVKTAYDADGTTYESQGVTISKSTTPPTPAAPTGTVSAMSWSATAGRGKVVLSWASVLSATGYKVWVFDGNTYRFFDVGNVTSWDSNAAKVYPDEIWLDQQADNSASTDPFNHAQGGFDLRDDPVKLYRKTIGTTYDSSHNYWFSISAYNASGESPIGSAFVTTLPNRTDITVPSGTISVIIPEDAVAPASITVNLASISDTESGLSQMRLSNDNVTWSTWETYITTKTWTTSTGEGQKTVYAQVKDVVGNTSNFSVNFWLGATLTQIYNEAQAAAQKAEAARLAAEATKTYSEAAKIAAENAENSAWIASEKAADAAEQTWYSGTYGGTSENVADTAGYIRNTQLPELNTKINNLQTTVNNIQTSDTIPPTIDLQTVSGARATSGSSIQAIVTVSDNKPGPFTYSINGGTYNSLPVDGRISLPVAGVGNNLITVSVKDVAGNIASKTINIRRL